MIDASLIDNDERMYAELLIDHEYLNCLKNLSMNFICVSRKNKQTNK